MKPDFSECKLLTQKDIVAEESELMYKLDFIDRPLLFSSDMTTKEYQDVVLERK